MGFRIMARDARAQRRDAERLGVAQRPGKRRARCRDRACGRRRRRLSDLHVDHLAAGGLDAAGCRHHVHHHERRHIAARGGRDQAFCRILHRVWPVDRRLRRAPAALLPYSASSVSRASEGGGATPRVPTCRAPCNGRKANGRQDRGAWGALTWYRSRLSRLGRTAGWIEISVPNDVSRQTSCVAGRALATDPWSATGRRRCAPRRPGAGSDCSPW